MTITTMSVNTNKKIVRGTTKKPFSEDQKKDLMIAFFTNDDKNHFLDETLIDRQLLRNALKDWEATPALHKLMLLYAEAKKTIKD